MKRAVIHPNYTAVNESKSIQIKKSLKFFETVVDREVLQFWDALDQKHQSSFEFFWSENNRFLVCTMTNRHHRLQAHARRDRQADVKLSPPDLSCSAPVNITIVDGVTLMEDHPISTACFLATAGCAWTCVLWKLSQKQQHIYNNLTSREKIVQSTSTSHCKLWRGHFPNSTLEAYEVYRFVLCIKYEE